LVFKRYTDSMKTEIKAEIIRMVEHLPDDATWDDVQQIVALRQSVDRGLADSAAGRRMTTDQLREHLNNKLHLI
jgi:predicted transcriptional regulator